MKSTIKTLQLHRAGSTSHGTPSLLKYNGEIVCWMLELPDHENARNISSIPKGKYKVKHLPRSGSGKYIDVYHVLDVPNRSGILIHSGNYAGDRSLGLRTHSYGCLLPASRLGILSDQIAGLASKNALRNIHDITNRKSFYLEIL